MPLQSGFPQLFEIKRPRGSNVGNDSPVIKWSGSKRSQAKAIVSLFPQNYSTYYEPFVGGGSVLYAAQPIKAIAGDICEPLIALWKTIQFTPDELINHYTLYWNRLKNEGHLVYYEVRDQFNKFHNPCDLFFLSRTCVNGLIRFNSKGEFNNSLHHTRKGIEPEKVTQIVHNWSKKLAKVDFRIGDYRETTSDAKSSDLIYLDPPYFHTRGRYYGRIEYKDFLDYLESLNRKGIRFLLSYDGKRAKKEYGTPLPENLFERKFYLRSGNSPFRKVMEKEAEMVEEALYLNW